MEDAGNYGYSNKVANKTTIRGCDALLRFLALALCLAAAITLGVDKQSTTLPIKVAPSLPPLNVPVSAHWHYLSAFVFFVIANAIACAHSMISLIIALANRGANKGIATFVVLGDLVMVALLFSSVGAAIAIGLMGYKGNTHVQWKEVCNVFDKFCNQAAAAFALSGAAAITYFVLVVLATLHNRKH